MNNIFEIKEAQKEDISQVLKIYNYYINFGFANFEEDEMSYENFYKLYQDVINLHLPFLVAKQKEKIIGFTYLNKFRNKSGYKFTFENSIYVDHNNLRKGVGNSLLINLLAASKKNRNIKNIIAVIGSYESESSIKIHEKNGFENIGTLRKIGFKKDKWLDAIYMQKILNEKN